MQPFRWIEAEGMSTARRIAWLICLGLAIALLGYGIIQPVAEETRWLLALWLSAPLLLLAVHLAIKPAPAGTTRSVQRLVIVIGVGFAMLSAQLLRQQFVQAEATSNYVYIDPQTGQSTSNVRPIIQAQQIKRGQILDRNGVVLADSEIVADGFVRRTYPLPPELDHRAFGNLLGYFSNRFGASGLEATYGSYLSGDGDNLGRMRNAFLGEARVGDNLNLTLNARLQDAAWRILGDRLGAIVVLDPETGAVLAMAGTPGFDPRGLAFDPSAPDRAAENQRVAAFWGDLNRDGIGQPLLFRPTQGRYPPGSVYKTVTAVAALENPREAQPDQISCPDEFPTEAGAPPVVNAVREGLEGIIRGIGEPNLERVYAFSCNTAFAQYALRLGPQRMIETARNFDIVRPGEVEQRYSAFSELPTEMSTLYAEPGFLERPAALADTGYGQGQLQVTPLQMAMVAAAIANDGILMQPYLVDRVTRTDGSSVTRHVPRTIRRAMSSATAAHLRTDMQATVEYGFGRPAQGMPREIAIVGGKSGTAEFATGQVPHAWFIAIAPVDRPRYAVAVIVESGGEGSSVGAQAAGQILAAAFELEK